MRPFRPLAAAAAAVALLLGAVACNADDGAGVRNLEEDGTGSGTHTGTGSGTHTGTGSGTHTGTGTEG